MRIFSPPVFTAILALTTIFSGNPALASQFESVPGEFVIKLKKRFQEEDLPRLSDHLKAQIKSAIPKHQLIVIRKPLVESDSSVLRSLRQNPNVEIAEPNFIYRANRTPNDPLFEKLWGLKNTGQSDERANGIQGVDIDVERAWELTTGSETVVVAVIDTGIDLTHPDLIENLWVNKAEKDGAPGVDDDQNGYVDDVHGYDFVDAENPLPSPNDDNGHGTHCAGVIGARGNDGKGIVGVNWKVKVMAAKFLGPDGGGTLEGAVRAIDYAVQMKAKILSNSWGGGPESEILKEAIQRSHEAGALFVAAAGNDAVNNDLTPTYPASYKIPNILAVAAVDNQGQLAAFSNFGKKSVHVAAPGVNVYSSVKGGTYESWSGTSMATPHVAGIAALLSSQEPKLSAVELRQRILSTAKPLAGVRNKVSSGGLANAYFALINQVAPPDLNDPIYWSKKDLQISSKHPYDRLTEETFEVEVAGAKEISLFFSRFDTERGYDKVTLFNRQGEVVGEVSGVMDDSFSPVIKGDYVRIVLTSDDSMEKYGFDLTKVAYR